MATITTRQISGSPLCGNPIMYQVQAGSYQSPVFHRVKMQVVAGLQGGNYRTIGMSSPAAEGELLLFDVSSALQAVADSYEYGPVPPEYYPYIQYYLVAWDEYMINGIGYESAKDYFPDNYAQSPLRALMGAYSDMERLLAGENKQSERFSRKPSGSPEIVYVGDVYLRPDNMVVHSGNITHGQHVSAYEVSTEGMQTLGGAQVYARPLRRDVYQMRFINSLGAMESLSVSSLRTTQVPIQTDRYNRAVQETFGTMSRGMTRKQNDYETWKLTSGPLDDEWTDWFIHEFLMTNHCWLNVAPSGTPLWVACHVIPEETVAGISRKDASMLEVEFSLQMDIRGSVMSVLAV